MSVCELSLSAVPSYNIPIVNFNNCHGMVFKKDETTMAFNCCSVDFRNGYFRYILFSYLQNRERVPHFEYCLAGNFQSLPDIPQYAVDIFVFNDIIQGTEEGHDKIKFLKVVKIGNIGMYE